MERCVRAITVAFFSFSLLLFSIPAVAGDDDSPRENSLHPGSWSIQFQIEDDIGFKPYNGMAISMKRHTSRKSAFRTGLNLGLDFSDRNTDDVVVYADTLQSERDTELDANSQNVRLEFIYLRYPNPDATVNWFFGTGPLVGFSRSESERKYTTESSVGETVSESSSTSKTWSVGVVGTAGVEWFATRGISFHAEYRASATYGKTKQEQWSEDEIRPDVGEDRTRKSESEADSSFWNFDSVEVLLGISVYF